MTKIQDRIFASPKATRQGVARRFGMTKLQDSNFAPPTAARQGAAQGGAA